MGAGIGELEEGCGALDGGAPDASRPDASRPDATVPDATAPDATAPDASQAASAGTWVRISPAGHTTALGIGNSASSPSTLYVYSAPAYPPSGNAGIYKTTNGGDSWVGPIGTKFYNYDGSTYSGPNPWSQGVAWTIAVDPTNANVVYAMCAFWGPQGLWKSTDGGSTWRSLMSNADRQAMSSDLYAIAIDPRNPQHVLVTFHSGWAFGQNAGVAESKDGGATWIQHRPTGAWGAGHYAFFLERDDAGNATSDAWILATQSNGFWRTMNAGQSWTQVSSQFHMQHGAGGMYRASTGALYMGAVNRLIRSTDNGRTWANANAPSNQDGYNTVIGDGVRMYVQTANTGSNTTGPQAYYTSSETNGTQWTVQNTQRFANGPGWMAADRNRKVLYSSTWEQGLWRLFTGN